MAKLRRRDARSWRCRFVWLAAAGALAVSTDAPAQAPEGWARALLIRHLGFSEKELRQAEQGRPVVRSLETSVDREVAIFGAIRVRGRVEDFLDRFRDIEQFERGAGVLQIHKISDPPLLSDFSDLTLPDDDFEALPRCRVGDCLMKVDEYALRRYQTEVDWTRPSARAQANALTRQLLLETVVAYQQGGNRALARLRDQRSPTAIGQEFMAMMEHAPYLEEFAPALGAYLREYPAARPPDVEEFFYWSKVNFGLRDTIRVNHVVICRDPAAPGGVATASKMLWASHYFYTALDLRFLVPAPGGAEKDAGFYLLALLRSRQDGLTGTFGWVVRRRAVKGSTQGLESYLRSVQRALEQPR